MGQAQAGDIGTKVRYNAQEDLSDQTMLKLKYKKPDGTIGEWDAIVYDNNYAEYTTLTTNDLQAGITEIQIYIESPTWTGHSEKRQFPVESNIS